MVFSKSMEARISFAKFVALHRLQPVDLAELLVLADRAFNAGERECNTGKSAAAMRARDAFEARAKPLRFGVDWPGLLPALKRRGETIHLPC